LVDWYCHFKCQVTACCSCRPWLLFSLEFQTLLKVKTAQQLRIIF